MHHPGAAPPPPGPLPLIITSHASNEKLFDECKKSGRNNNHTTWRPADQCQDLKHEIVVSTTAVRLMNTVGFVVKFDNRTRKDFCNYSTYLEDN